MSCPKRGISLYHTITQLRVIDKDYALKSLVFSTKFGIKLDLKKALALNCYHLLFPEALSRNYQSVTFIS